MQRTVPFAAHRQVQESTSRRRTTSAEQPRAPFVILADGATSLLPARGHNTKINMQGIMAREPMTFCISSSLSKRLFLGPILLGLLCT